jgi:NRPS condensation-like uncharacterized protein
MMEREALGVLDEAILHLDSHVEPWSVHLEVRYGKVLDERRLGEAVGTALDRHPAARARLVTSARRPSYEWVASPSPDVDPYDVVHCDSDAALAAAREELLSRPVPLDVSPPLRIRLARHPDGDVVMLNLHHAAGDGMAALVFLQSVARAYAGRPEAVADLPRGPRGPAVTRLGRPQLRAVAGELLEAARPSARIASEGEPEAPGYAVHLLALDAARTQALRDRGRSDGATVNDLLLAALHLCVADWNAGHGAPARRVSVLMPVNLRPRRVWGEGFGNFTFMVPVSTLPRDRFSAPMTVAAVRRRTAEVKTEHTPIAVVSCLQRLRCLPVAFRRALVRLASTESVVPTTLLSNLGVMEHDLDLGPGVGAPTQVWFSPPAKMPLGLAVGAVTADEQLHVTFRVRHPLMGRQALASFAAAYESALDTVIDVGEPFLRPVASRARAA